MLEMWSERGQEEEIFCPVLCVSFLLLFSIYDPDISILLMSHHHISADENPRSTTCLAADEDYNSFVNSV